MGGLHPDDDVIVLSHDDGSAPRVTVLPSEDCPDHAVVDVDGQIAVIVENAHGRLQASDIRLVAL